MSQWFVLPSDSSRGLRALLLPKPGSQVLNAGVPECPGDLAPESFLPTDPEKAVTSEQAQSMHTPAGGSQLQ